MSKAEGKKIAIKFTQPLNNLILQDVYSPDAMWSRPVGTITRSSQYSSSWPATNVFDNNTGTFWYVSAASPQWIMIDLGVQKAVVGYRIYSGTDYRPKNVELYGSDDGVNFDLLTQNLNSYATGWNEHLFVALKTYRYYKWIFTDRYSTNLWVYEIQLLYATLTQTSGNENAFTISGEEYLWLDGPNNNGPLIEKTYAVKQVLDHIELPNTINLEMLNSFRNVQGDLIISYDQALGALAGVGGAVASFEETFVPEDLAEGLTDNGGAVGAHEYINASINTSLNLKYITKIQGYHGNEYINSSIVSNFQLIHIDDINP